MVLSAPSISLLFALLLIGFSPFRAVAAPGAEADLKEVVAAYEKLSDHMRGGDFRVALPLMSQATAKTIIGEYLLMAADVAQGNPETAAEKRVRDACQAISKKYGLIEAVPSEYFEGTEFSYDEFDALMARTYESLLAAVNTSEKRLAALGEIHEALMTQAPELAWQYVEHPFYETGGTLAELKSKNGSVSVRLNTTGESRYLLFEQDAEGWLWSGYDSSRAGAEPSFTPVNQISVSGKTLDGASVSLADMKGKVVLVDFWGTWCAPCVAEMPNLKKIYKKLKPHGFEIIGVASDNREALSGFLKRRELPWPNILDADGSIVSKFRVSSFPTALLVDQQGEHFESNVFGADMLRVVAQKLNLEPEVYEPLLEELSEEDNTVDTSHAEAGEEAIGFEPADADGNGVVSRSELKQYLAIHLEGVELPHAGIFDRLDDNNNGTINEEEFASRHEVIEHFMGDDFFDEGLANNPPRDPGGDFVIYQGLAAGVNDGDVYGALYHRYDEVLKRVEPDWSAHDLSVLPHVARANKVAKLMKGADRPNPNGVTRGQSVDRLMRSTVIMVGGGKDSFFTSGGVVVSRDGLVVTNYHVAKELELTPMAAFTHDGKAHHVVEFIAGSRERDTALVRLEGEDFDYAPIATELPKTGDDLVMVHHSENRFYTYDRGYLMRRPMIGEHAWMEVSMNFAPGGSGCGIYNKRNELVGLVSTLQFGDGPSLSKPVDWDNVDWEEEGDGGASAILMVKQAVSLSSLHALIGKPAQAGLKAASRHDAKPNNKPSRRVQAAKARSSF